MQSELAQRAAAEAQWRQERAEAQARYETQAQALATEQARLADKTQQWKAVTDELSATRRLIEDEALQRRKLASRIIDLERAKAELTEQLNTGRNSHANQLSSIQSLESQLQQRREEIEQAERLLRAMTSEQRRLQLHAEDLGAQLHKSSERLAEKAGAELFWKQREAELESLCPEATGPDWQFRRHDRPTRARDFEPQSKRSRNSTRSDPRCARKSVS